MEIDIDSLNDWAELLFHAEVHLERVIGEALLQPEQAAELQLCLGHVGHVKRNMVRKGAANPLAAALEKTRAAMEEAGFEAPPRPQPLSPELLASDTNQKYCRLLQQLFPVAIERDRERGWYPEGPAQAVAEMLADAEGELYANEPEE